MSEKTITATPALAASQASWRCVQSGDREGWLALMADDVVIEDPIGQSVTNPDGSGVKGKEAVGRFFEPDGDQSAPRQIRIPAALAARTSVVAPYSQILLNGDHTTLPP